MKLSCTKAFKYLSLIALFLLCAFSFAKADILMPAKTTMYFRDNGQPINGVVEFKIDCYGYLRGIHNSPKTIAPDAPVEKIYTFSGTCPKYGCELEQYNTNSIYSEEKYCSITGKSPKGSFSIEKIQSPRGSSCIYNRVTGKDSCTVMVDISKQSANLAYSVPHLVPILSLIVTIILEFLVVLFFVRKIWKSDKRLFGLVGAGLVPSIITWPIANYILSPAISNTGVSFGNYLTEGLVIVAETFLLMWILRLGLKKSFILSLIANIVSYSIGLLIFRFLI